MIMVEIKECGPDISCVRGILHSVALPRRETGPRRRSTIGGWTEEEDKVLIAAVQEYNGKSWKKIAERVPNRNDVQCLHRWKKVLDPDLVKGPWSKEEDDLIVALVSKKGTSNWSEIAKHLPGRIGKQCRERWHNHLKPDIRRTAWTREEELTLIEAHKVYGNKWAEIAKLLKGRTENMIKNHWNCSLRKRVEHQLRNQQRGKQFDLNSTVEETCQSPRNQQIDVLHLPFRAVPEKRGIGTHESTGERSSVDLPKLSYSQEQRNSSNPVRTITGVFLSISKTPPNNFQSPDHGMKHCKILDLNKCSTSWSFPSSHVGTTMGPYSLWNPPRQAQEISLKSCISDPPRQVRDLSFESCLSELKSAARSFKNIPSIIRKRKTQTTIGREHTSETVSTSAIGENKDGFNMCQMVRDTDVANSTEQYIAKQLLPSPPKSRKLGTSAIESVGKNLENAFNAAAEATAPLS
ncbi:hypothetical protein ACJRO7_019267 [Eucalyptus globulus]|uniref:Uncharacterized protein n=1 Tax=Eucalyptus globulus TaxID=34317 RepID=A0ABD3KIJ4_EUCGL